MTDLDRQLQPTSALELIGRPARPTAVGRTETVIRQTADDPKPPAQDAKADLRRAPPERLTRQARRTRIRRFEASGLG